MGALERRAEAISGDFTPQDVANILWSSMGRHPGERMMGQLERRVEVMSGMFNSQAVVRMRWSYAKMWTKPGERMKALLEPPTHLSLQHAGKRKDRDGETRK